MPTGAAMAAGPNVGGRSLNSGGGGIGGRSGGSLGGRGGNNRASAALGMGGGKVGGSGFPALRGRPSTAGVRGRHKPRRLADFDESELSQLTPEQLQWIMSGGEI